MFPCLHITVLFSFFWVNMFSVLERLAAYISRGARWRGSGGPCGHPGFAPASSSLLLIPCPLPPPTRPVNMATPRRGDRGVPGDRLAAGVVKINITRPGWRGAVVGEAGRPDSPPAWPEAVLLREVPSGIGGVRVGQRGAEPAPWVESVRRGSEESYCSEWRCSTGELLARMNYIYTS